MTPILGLNLVLKLVFVDRYEGNGIDILIEMPDYEQVFRD